MNYENIERAKRLKYQVEYYEDILTLDKNEYFINNLPIEQAFLERIKPIIKARIAELRQEIANL